MPFSAAQPKHKPKKYCMLSLEGRKSAYAYLKQIPKGHIHKYFACYIIFQLF